MSTWHVIPTDDLDIHDESSLCGCRPAVSVVEESGDILIVHNSFDGREYIVDAHLIQRPNV